MRQTKRSNRTACFFASLGLLVVQACTTSAEVDDNVYRLSATLSGAAERPNPANTPATGTLRATYNNINNRLEYTVTWGKLSDNASAAHFHGPAGPEEVAPPVIGVPNFPANTDFGYTGTAVLTEEQEQQLLSGQWYFNIHTPTFPAGEIRGQITSID